MGRKLIVGLIILVLGVAGLTGVISTSRNGISERAKANQEYQNTWKNISENIDNILPLSNVLTEEYSNVMGTPAIHKRFVDLNIRIKDNPSKNEKYSAYKELVGLIREIEKNKDLQKVKENEILSSGLENIDKYINTIDKMTIGYNKSIEKYNETFGSVMNRESKSKGILKQETLK